MGFCDLERVPPKATPDAVQGGTPFSTAVRGWKCKESRNHHRGSVLGLYSTGSDFESVL